MSGMGIGTAYGAEGAADALRQIIKARIEAQQRDQELAQQTFTNNRLTANDARLAEEHTAAMEDRRAAQQATQSDRQTGLANTLGDQLPAGTEIAPTDQAVGLLQGGGRGSLLRGNMTLPSTQTSGGMTMPDDSGASIRGSLRSMSSPEALRSYTKLPSEKQNTDAAKSALEAAQADKALHPTTKPGQLVQDEKGNYVRIADDGSVTPTPVKGYHAPQQPIVVQMPTGPGLLNRGTGVATPVKDAGGKDVGVRPSAQSVEHTRTNTEALDTLAQLDQAIDAAKDKIGPGMGRVSNLEQMAGSADPAIQALGVKMKAAKMRVDHAVTGSVRAGASPMMMQQWDNILANKVTPEGLKAGVQAMREIISGGAATGTGKPTAEELIKKYGGS